MSSLRAALAAAAVLALCACQRSPESAPMPEPAAKPAAAATAPTPPPAAPMPVKPADNVAFSLPGDFSADTDATALEQRYGKDHVRIAQVPGAEGETSRGIVLFPDDSKRRAYLYFQDEETLRRLDMVRVMDADTQWTLDNGLRMGMPLKDVVALNGKPIRFYGLEWDYGGSVTSLNGGKLEARKEDSVVRRFQLGTSSGEPMPDNAYPSGDSEFSSDDPAYPRQGDLLTISEIAVAFPAAEAR